MAFLPRHMLVQEGIFVEAGGEEAAQLGPHPRAWARPRAGVKRRILRIM